MDLKSLDIQLIRATYGKNKYIDVTSIIKKTMNTSFIVNNNLFKYDPEFGVKKELIMYFADDTYILIPEKQSFTPNMLNTHKITINNTDLNESLILFKNTIPNKFFNLSINTKIDYTNYNFNDNMKFNYAKYPIEKYNFIKDFDKFMNLIKKKYNINHKLAQNTIMVLYYSEYFNSTNFLLDEYNNVNKIKTFNSYAVLELIFRALKNIKWDYLVYTEDDIIIEDVLFINNIFTIYKIKPVISNYCIFINNSNNILPNDCGNTIWITTHQKLFINNIYKVTPKYIEIIPLKYKNTAYVLTINNDKYNNFIANAQNININFIKFYGINKNDLSINHVKGHLACLFGHYMILKTYFKSENILIIEDDNNFTDNFNKRWDIIKSYLDSNPDEWDIFNGNTAYTIYPYDMIVINDEKLIKFTNNTKTNFIYYNKKIIPRFIEYFETFYYKLMNNKLNNDWVIDRFLRVFKCVTSIPFLTNEIKGSISSINGCEQKYNTFTTTSENDINKIINNLYNNTIYVILSGGFGNQLFMLFNAISLSVKYGKKLFIYYDQKYADNCKNDNIIRNPSYEYNIFKLICFHKITNTNNYTPYKEPCFKYNTIILKDNINYIIHGYYQSFNYFWENINEIKKYLYIDNILIDKIKNKYNSFNKKILAIHYRLGDYVKLNNYHPVQPIEYFKMALSYYNLDDYQIILFSDDIEMAQNKLQELKLNYIIADDIYMTDEEQFYMLCLSHVRICSNSSFSLMSCYFNEMYNFIEDAEYIFPYKWFGVKGPEYNMNDLTLNYKFYVINYDNPIKIKYDVVSMVHIKDKERYNTFLKYNKKFLQEAGQFYYVSYENFKDINSIHLSENKYPFTKKEIISYIEKYIPDYRWGWYYQQLLKLYIFRIDVIINEYVLILDSDILLLKNLLLFENNIPLLFKRNTMDKKMHKPYYEFLKLIYPNINYDINDSGICHFMLFKKDQIEMLLNEIEKKYDKPAWQALLDAVIKYIDVFGYSDSIMSEYELYYHYIKSNNIYKIKNNLEYIDAPILNFNFINTKYVFIADHDYLTRGAEWKQVNLIEEDNTILKTNKNTNESSSVCVSRLPLSKELYNDYNNYINNLFINYQQGDINNRKHISNINNKITSYLTKNDIQYELQYSKYYEKIMNDNYLKETLKYGDYDNIYIYHNKNAKLKNHIIILNKAPIDFDEIILNVNYTIICDNLPEYIYAKPTSQYNINDIEYIIYDNNTIKLPLIQIETHIKFKDFISSKILFLQICIPSFDNLPDRLKEYSTINNNIFWNIKMDKYLCEMFIKKNYHDYIYLAYALIYSTTSKTDLIRHLFLYKFGGCYFDLSVKIINDVFYDMLNYYDFITCRDENYNLLQNGILFIKNRHSIISQKMIIELLSGVINYNLNINMSQSYLYKRNPCDDPFFYGPLTLYDIYNEIKDMCNCKILTTMMENKIKLNDDLYEFESYSFTDTLDKTKILQVKYIGYNSDIRNSMKNKHYSLNYKNNLFFNSPLEYFDKIIIINLEHRKDRKTHILNEFKKLCISMDKIEFIEAIYNKMNGVMGCTMSHIKSVEYAINNNLNNVLIVEDDFCFPENINMFNINLLKFFILNIKWDGILFTISEHGPPININTNINNIYMNIWSQSAACYAINNNIFNDIIINYNKCKEINNGGHDYYWNELKNKFNWFVIKDTIGSQINSYSDIEHKNSNYTSAFLSK